MEPTHTDPRIFRGAKYRDTDFGTLYEVMVNVRTEFVLYIDYAPTHWRVSDLVRMLDDPAWNIVDARNEESTFGPLT